VTWNDEEGIAMAQTIGEVMTRHPVTLPADFPVRDAAVAMRDADIGDVIVLEEGDQICGIVTDRDIALRVIGEGREPTTRRGPRLRQLRMRDPRRRAGLCALRLQDHRTRGGSRRFDVLLRPLCEPGRR
jgi:CBS-domain-containing membrane protein